MTWITSARVRGLAVLVHAVEACTVGIARSAGGSEAALGSWRYGAFLLAIVFASLGLLAPMLPAEVLGATLLLVGGLLTVVPMIRPLGGRATFRQPVLGLAPYQPALAITSVGVETRHASLHQGKTWSELLGRVSHELRTPLNAVIGFSDAMTMELFGPVGHPRYREYLQHIRDSGFELLKSAEDTLALASLLTDRESSSRNPRTPNDLSILAQEAWDFFKGSAIARGVSFEADLERGAEVLGERRILRQVLINLFLEGLHQCTPGVQLRFAARSDGERLVVWLQVAARPAQSSQPSSLAIAIARALLELQGTSLLEVRSDSHWQAMTVLDRALQSDFFPSGRSHGLACS